MELARITPGELARQIGIDRATLYRKLGAGIGKFTIGEAREIIGVLGLSDAEAAEIFFRSE